jgi:two-component system chemotaxis response regulator CheB
MTHFLRVLVVDDSAIFRKVISDALATIPGVEVIGTANNGAIALSRIVVQRPDLVLLDIEMPELNGFEVLQAIRRQGLDVGVIIVSAFTRRGSEMTIRALELGAFDFITKSTEGTAEQNREAIRAGLESTIKAFSRRHEIRSILKGTGPALPAKKPEGANFPGKPRLPGAADLPEVSGRMNRLAQKFRATMVLIGVSTGGPNALTQMLPRIPADINVPIFIVQHMPPLFTHSLAESLNGRCSIRVKEAEEGEVARMNTAYIAPGGSHMKIVPGQANEITIRITQDPPENNCRPAVDYLFRSAAQSFPARACAVIMTGMGSDGTRGLKLLKQSGCLSIAQDAETCVVFGMPKEAIDAGVIDVVSPLDGLSQEIYRAVKGF